MSAVALVTANTLCGHVTREGAHHTNQSLQDQLGSCQAVMILL